MTSETDPHGEAAARLDRIERLYQVSQVIHSTLDPQEALQLILRETVRLTGATSGSVVLINPTTDFLEIQAVHGLPPNADRLRLRLGEGITGWVARTGKPARVGAVQSDPRYIMLRPDVSSELAVPLRVNDEVRGVLNVDATRPDAFTAEHQGLLEELAVQAAGVIRNTWLYEQFRLKARLFESLVSVGQAINSALGLDEALLIITREACQLIGGKMASLLLLDASGEWLDLRACHGGGTEYLMKPRLNVNESLLGIVVRRQKPLQVENVQTSGRYQHVEIARREGLISLLSVPLVFHSQAIGTLSVYSGMPHSYSNEEIRILSALAEFSAIAIEKARLYDRIVAVEDQLRQTEKLSALGLLAAEIAHEIRNPLAVLKMLFHSLELRFPADDPRARDVEVMERKMDHLDHVMERVLAFARGSEPRFSSVNVPQLLDDLGLLLRPKLHQQNIEFVRELAPNLPSLWGDATQLEQAFLNLTLNAVEAMPNGGRLTIRARGLHPSRRTAAPTHLALAFRDTGAGMTEEQRRRAFTSLLSTTKPKGTGLGLVIVARVVEVHHGRVRIASQPGRGTTITLVFPVGPPAE